MKCKEVMSHILFDTMPGWIKYHDEKNTRNVRKVYSIGDLRYMNDSDRLSSDMSKVQYDKLKRHLPSSSNLTLNSNTMLTSTTLGKLLVRKFTHRSTTDMTKSTNDLNSNYPRKECSSMGINTISMESIQLIERIGGGKFSNVFKALYRTKQKELLTVAVKTFEREINADTISKELHLFQEIKHPHIVHFFGYVLPTVTSIMFVTEYASCESLAECVTSTDAKRDYSIQIFLEFFKQIASAMSYLEKKCIIHGNLSCRNYLVFNKSLIKLSDLSFDHRKDKGEPLAGSDIYSFGLSMWECFTYGHIPWNETSNEEIVNTIDVLNPRRLSRPPHATSELYQIMLHCCNSEPSGRPTFSQLGKTLAEIELKQVRWKDDPNPSSNLPDDFLPQESCRLGPLTIIDRCLHILPSSASHNMMQCVSVDGQIGFVYNSNVEPLHVISFPKQTIVPTTSTTMNQIFHRKLGIKKNSTKSKSKPISKDMIGAPQPDLVHAFHVGVSGETFGDITCLSGTETTDQPTPTPINSHLSKEPTSSLLDEVMQAFTDIYTEMPSITDLQSEAIDVNRFPADNMTDSNNRSPSVSRFLSKVTVKKSNEQPCRFSRELEERSKNGDLSEQGKTAYNLLINRYTSNSSASSSSSSSYQEKSDCHSHYSSVSTDNDDNHSVSSLNSRSSSNNKSVVGQPLPPPPDLSTLGSKLTTASMAENFKLPETMVSNKYRIKKRFNLFA